MKKISSIKNPEIRFLKRISKNGGVFDDYFLVEGEKLVEEVEKSRHKVLKIYSISEVPGTKIESILISEGISRYLSNFPSPSRIFALCRKCEGEFREILPALVLDGIQNPENLGGISRSAEAFGFNTIYLTAGSVDPFKFKVIRSSMGSSLRINFIEMENPSEFIEKKVKEGVKFYLTDKTGNLNLYKISPVRNTLIVFGNEGHGISDTFKVFRETIFIPMNERVNSLNLLGSASIVMSYFYFKFFKEEL